MVQDRCSLLSANWKGNILYSMQTLSDGNCGKSLPVGVELPCNHIVCSPRLLHGHHALALRIFKHCSFVEEALPYQDSI